jgi:hypothetical protein
MERVQGVRTNLGSDWSALINTTAEAWGIPPRLLLACAIAECGLNEQCQPGVTGGMARYGTYPDVSFGPCHQAVAWAPYGDHTNTPANIEACRQKFCGDLAFAFMVAARNLREKWDRYGPAGDEVLSRYNAPGLSLAENPNRRNISYAWRISAQHVVTEEDAPMAEFQAGFAELAAQLGADVVGEPVQDEWHPNGDPTMAAQVTTKGLMLWASGAPAHFIPAVTA